MERRDNTERKEEEERGGERRESGEVQEVVPKPWSTEPWEVIDGVSPHLKKVLYCCTLFMFGGPCHLSSFIQCSEDLILL